MGREDSIGLVKNVKDWYRRAGWVVLVVVLGGCAPVGGGMEEVAGWVRRSFPEVKQVSTAEVEGRMGEVVLLDVRSAEEFEVSHLAGARWVDPGKDVAGQVGDVPRDAEVVVYCSVGYRSSGAARQLLHAGWVDVANMEGGIFQWANEGRPVGPAGVVHPYDRNWGRLLGDEVRGR